MSLSLHFFFAGERGGGGGGGGEAQITIKGF